GRFGAIEPLRTAEYRGGAAESRNDQAVPVGEDLVIAAGTHAMGAGGEQHLAGAGEGRFLRGRAGRRDSAQDGLAFPIARRGDVIGSAEGRRVGAELPVNLAGVPDVEPTFLAFAVRVLRGREGRLTVAVRLGGHVADQPAD